MPPLVAWYKGRDAIGQQLREMAMPRETAGQRRFAALRANGLPAVAVWRKDPPTGRYAAEAIHVLGLTDQGQVQALTAFLAPALFPSFGLEVLTG